MSRHTLLGMEPDDRVMPALFSDQWACTLPLAQTAAQSTDYMFLCGGGIPAYADGPAAGIASLRQAYEAISAGEDLAKAAAIRPALAYAMRFLVLDDWPFVEQSDPRVLHFQVCPTFDSGDRVGSIDHFANELVTRFKPVVVAVISGQPSFGRYFSF